MRSWVATLAIAGAMMLVVPATAGAQVWDEVSGTPPEQRGGARAYIQPEEFRAFELDRSQLDGQFAAAPQQQRAARSSATGQVLRLPAPDGGFQRFAVEESPIME